MLCHARTLQLLLQEFQETADALRQLALHDQGIVCLSDFMTKYDIAAGRLVKVLQPLVRLLDLLEDKQPQVGYTF